MALSETFIFTAMKAGTVVVCNEAFQGTIEGHREELIYFHDVKDGSPVQHLPEHTV